VPGVELQDPKDHDNDSQPTPMPAAHTGTLYQLSNSMREKTRELAATGLYVTVYDNININFRNPEQIIGHHGE
jgi:hypothetical protein